MQGVPTSEDMELILFLLFLVPFLGMIIVMSCGYHDGKSL